jgi:glucose-6-phosphate 1-dehydrogenase
MGIKQPTILVIIGISGDLARRRLLPAISRIAESGELSEKFRIVGITRQSGIEKEDLLGERDSQSDYLWDHLELFRMDLLEAGDYKRLDQRLGEIVADFGEPSQYLFYLSVPPQVSPPIIELLGETGLSAKPGTKILLEKPFGVDLASAQELVEHITRYFSAEQIYRIDHYLAKESVQNIITFRQDNALFKRTWDKDFIERIEISASEEISINGRSIFYEQTGALRDLVQGHLLQLAALILMDLPESRHLEDVPARRLAALRQLRLPEKPVIASVKRGQYKGYQEDVNNPGSAVETFVSVLLESDDPKWEGVPITLTTGKSLDKKFTGITIFYKKSQSHEANNLTIRLQPDEGIELSLWAKKPGYDRQVECHQLRFTFQEYYTNLPEAYEQVLFDAINSDHSLFASSAEILETWRILDVIQRAWGLSSADLIFYQPGSSIKEVLDLENFSN